MRGVQQVMVLEELRRRGKAIKERSIKALAALYPPETAEYLTRERDRFRNPLGYALTRAVDDLFESVLEDSKERLGARESFGEAVRILAVQELGPSEALSFVRVLKEEVRRGLVDVLTEAKDFRELLMFEARLDEAMMEAFDLYMESRERIGRVRINEIRAEKERLYRLLAALDGRGDRGTPEHRRASAQPADAAAPPHRGAADTEKAG